MISCWRSNVWEMTELKLGGRERRKKESKTKDCVERERDNAVGEEKESKISSMCEPLTTN